jgi:hypothetical protein
MKPAPVLVLSVSAVLAASCVADVADGPDEQVGAAEEPGILRNNGMSSAPVDSMTAIKWWHESHHSPCAEACYDVSIDLCDWRDECVDVEPTDATITCVGKALTCDAAEHAANGEAWGLEWCFRSCGGLLGN